MGPIGCPETSARNCRNPLRSNPEERSYHLLCGESLKSRTFKDYLKLISTVDRKLAPRAEVKNKLSGTITLPHSLILGWTGTTFSHATRRNNAILTSGNFPVTNSHGICENSSLNITPISDFIYHLTDKFFGSCPAHPNPLIRSIGNYSLADLHRQYKKYIHKRPNHILL